MNEKEPDKDLGGDLTTEAPPAEFLAESAIKALVDRAQQGDGAALNDLFERYYDTMLSYARRRLGNKMRMKEDPDDLAQTTFREATRDFSGYVYRGEDSFLRWLSRILQNKIRDKAEFYSASKRDISRELSMEGDDNDKEDRPAFQAAAQDLSVTRFVQRDEEFEILREAIDELKADHRQAITKVVFQGLTLREAGEQMGGKSEDAVRMMLRRAERQLADLTRSRLEREAE